MSQDDAIERPEGDAFVPNPDELRRVAEEVAAQFPPPRLGTELVLLDVDPRRAHAYWNIDVEDFAAARLLAGTGESPLVLRMRDVTGDVVGPGASFDVEVQGLQNHWQVDLWQPGRAYVAEIGLRQPDGTLVGIVSSNRVETPRSAQSPDYDTVALNVGDLDLGPVATDLAVVAQASRAPAEETIADVPMLQDRYPEIVALPPPSAAGKAPEPVAPLPEIGPWPSVEEIVRQMPECQSRVEAYYQAQAPAPTAAAAPASAPASPPAVVAAQPASPGAQTATAPVPAPAPAPAPPSASLDQYVNLSSFVNGRVEVDLEVNVELHVYGRAKPGSQLTFYGQRVALRPDGTFSIRKPLPQGAVVLPLVLHSETPANDGKS